MKEEALELADFLEKNMVASVAILGDVTATHIVSTIRRLVEELDKQEYRNKHEGIIGKIGDCQIHDLVHRTTPQTKPLSDDVRLDFTKAYFNIHPDAHLSEQFKIKLYELDEFARAIEERHGIK